ncbi:MAG: CHRD domain-containing protein [Caulobacteraceae bacterium]|nr:CHRD domain-containing protein [Caulobacteraceae bacterium]
MRLTISATAAAVMLAIAGAAGAETLHFQAKLAGSGEVPPNSSAGKGTVTATLDTGSKAFTYDADYSGLSGPPLAAHFHGPAAPGENAPPVVPLKDAKSPAHGTATLTDAQIADLKAGKWYFNVHTAANKGGEIRGQLEAVK